MAYWLTKATGKPFEVKTGIIKGAGIQLQLVDQSNLPAPIKKQILADGQSFYLSIDGTNAVQIVGSDTNSFINGIYTFLQELGFRWYMPGDVWSIVPKLGERNIKINKVYTPDFQNRFYAGTGGVNPIMELDPQNTFKKDFDLWNRRNRLNSDHVMRGHTGQVFYSANKKELNAHPEYSCNGKVNQNGRIDISNAAAVNLFVNWALSQVNAKDKYSVIGVDPADGSGGVDDCLPSGIPEIKTWSDKYFWLANQVAQVAEEKGIKALVQLYAYSSHAAPPDFKLHPYVYPVIIPYAFQSVSSPEDFINLWRNKMDNRPMGIYDYWNITQWSSDLPQFNIYTIPEKLRLWKKSNINTINLESTNAKGPMGHAFWIASQMMWDASLSFDRLYNELLTQSFGPAANDIKRMYDRWSLRYQGAMDVAFSLNDLATASAKTSDPAVQKRISELKAYIHYLKLYYDYQYDATPIRYADLINYMYSIHNLRLLQTSALKNSYINKPAGAGTKPIVEEQNIASANGHTNLSLEAIERNFQSDLQENSVTYTISDFKFNIKKAFPVADRSKSQNNPLYINGPNSYSFYLASSQRLVLQAGATAETKLVIRDESGKTWYENEISASSHGYETIRVRLPSGRFVISFGDFARFSRIVFPVDIAFFSSSKNYDNAGYPMQYIYVPKDVTEVVYTDGHFGANGRGDWIDPDGKHEKPQWIKYSIYRVRVPPQYRGKVWILNIGHSSFQLLNIPDEYSLNLFGYKEP